MIPISRKDAKTQRKTQRYFFIHIEVLNSYSNSAAPKKPGCTVLMNTGKRQGGYLATSEGVKKLKDAKRIKKYTYEKIAQEAKETINKVKRLFNPHWGNGQYKIGEEAVAAI